MLVADFAFGLADAVRRRHFRCRMLAHGALKFPAYCLYLLIVGVVTLSVSQMPSHNHVIRNGATGTGTIPPMALIEGTANTTPTQYAGGSGSHTHSFSGGSHSHSISESTHSHSVSISAHTHGIGTVKTPPLAHSASATSAEANSLPPYVALHFLMYMGE